MHIYVCVYIYTDIFLCQLLWAKIWEKKFPGLSVVFVTDFEMWYNHIATDNPPWKINHDQVVL